MLRNQLRTTKLFVKRHQGAIFVAGVITAVIYQSVKNPQTQIEENVETELDPQ